MTVALPQRQPAPVTAAERIASLDVLRALALFGVLVVNLLTEFRVSIFAQFLGPAGGTALDRTIDRVVAVGIESKAFVVFSLLFGVGLAVQLERARRRGAAFGPHIARRLAALLAIGVVHLVFVWNGDILTEYAVAGVFVAPLVGLPPRFLLAIAALLLAVYVAPLPMPAPFTDGDALASHVEAANHAYGSGGLCAVQAFRIHELRPILALDLHALPRTLALFALGAWIWRRGIFQRPAEHRAIVFATATAGLLLGGAATAWSGGVFGEPSEIPVLSSVVEGLGEVALALGYVAAALAALQQRRVASVLRWLAPIGQMALTNYLGQSVVFGFIFYGYGLGFFGSMRVTPAALLGAVVYALQAAASAWWLRRFRFGPVEWAWRCATYATWQPMRR